MDRIFELLEFDEVNNNVVLEKKENRRKKKVKNPIVAPLFKDSGDYSDPPHPNLLRLPFSLLFVAPKGSGKTTTLQNVLVWYYRYFDMIFIWSPTINIDHKWQLIIDELEIPPEQLFDKYKEKDVNGLMGQIKDYNSGLESKDKIKTLFIFDDTVETLPKNKKISAINKLAMNHRHYNISHIIVSQSFKKLDTVIRMNTTGIILYNTDNSAERYKIVEELCGNLGKAKFEELWMDCVSEKFGFCYINYDTRKIFKNFTEEVGDLDCEPTYLFAKIDRQNEAASKRKSKNKTKEKKKEPENDKN